MCVAVACATRSAPWPQRLLRGFVHAAGGWAVRPVGLAVQSGRAGRRRIGCLHEEPSCNIVPPPCLLSRPPNSGTLRTPLEPGVSWNGHGSACPRWTGIRSWLFEIYLRSEYRWAQTPPLAWRAIAEIERTSRLRPERVYGICRSELALKVGLRHPPSLRGA